MQFETKNILLVGCGMVMEVGHLPAILRSRKARIAALMDSNTDNAKRLKRQYSIEAPIINQINSVDELRVDGAIIATPNDTHFPLAAELIAKNIPVLIEKPICNSSDEAEKLCTLAKQKNVIISVGYTTRYFPGVKLFKELLDSDYFGRIIRFEYEYGSVGGWAPITGYNIDRKHSGGGVLVVTGTHIIDRLLYWFGSPDTLEYQDDSHGGIEADCRAVFHYRNRLGDFSGSMFLSKVSELKNRFALFSEKFVCVMREGQMNAITVFPVENSNLRYEIAYRDVSDQPFKDPFGAQLNNFLDCLDGKGRPTVGAETATDSVKLIERMYASKTQLEKPWDTGK